jgi:ribonuclease HI
MLDVHIYTDGSCRSQDGPGGWGSVIVINDVTLGILVIMRMRQII